MKFVLTSLVLLASAGAMADQDLKVVSRDYSLNVTCETALVNDGYKEDVMVEYTYCKDQALVLEKVKSTFKVVLKVEGVDGFSQGLLDSKKVQGNHVGKKLNVRVTGVTE